tara:strand:+ start:851 stop:973 length:123 start_codon:yes stop_codon:yes gene_type:complete
MIKKILLIIIILTFNTSCGKKAEPEYKQSNNKNINLENII